GGVFQDGGSRVLTLLGRHYLAAQMRSSQENTDILLAIPLSKVLGNGMYIAAAISIGIGWGIILLQIYICRRLLRKRNGKDEAEASREWISRATRPGILAVIAFTVL